MFRSVFADVLDTEVVNHKGEAYIFGGMLPKGRGLSNGGVSKLGKVDLEPIVCNAAGLFQAWGMPLRISRYTHLLDANCRRLYWAMISSGSMSRLIFIYSYRPIGVL